MKASLLEVGDEIFARLIERGVVDALHYGFWRVYFRCHFKVLFKLIWPLKELFRR